MRLYLKGDYTKEIPFDYLELAKRMWFDTKDGKTVDISYFGNTRPFKTDPTIHLKLNKWMHDNRWNNVQLKEGIINKFGSHVYENLELDFEDNPATDYREKGDCLRLASTHLDLLTVDKRAMYIMEEIPFMDDVRDPVWEEDDRRNEEYIKIHGEPVYDDEEGE